MLYPLSYEGGESAAYRPSRSALPVGLSHPALGLWRRRRNRVIED